MDGVISEHELHAKFVKFYTPEYIASKDPHVVEYMWAAFITGFNMGFEEQRKRHRQARLEAIGRTIQDKLDQQLFEKLVKD